MRTLKSDLADLVAQRVPITASGVGVHHSSPQWRRHMTTKQAEQVFDAVLESISDALAASRRVAIPGFGVFSIRTRKGRYVRNPKTGGSMWLDETRTIGFRPAKELKGKLR